MERVKHRLYKPSPPHLLRWSLGVDQKEIQRHTECILMQTWEQQERGLLTFFACVEIFSDPISLRVFQIVIAFSSQCVQKPTTTAKLRFDLTKDHWAWKISKLVVLWARESLAMSTWLARRIITSLSRWKWLSYSDIDTFCLDPVQITTRQKQRWAAGCPRNRNPESSQARNVESTLSTVSLR